MAKKSNASTAGYGAIALLSIIVYLFTNKVFLIIFAVVVILGTIITIVYLKNKKKNLSIHDTEPDTTYAVFTDLDGNDAKLVRLDINSLPGDIPAYLAQALEAEASEDFLAARVFYMQAVEVLKRYNKKVFDTYIEPLQKMYDEFVLRDPYYKKLMKPLLQIIEKNNGILQSEITKYFQRSDWGALKLYNRPVLKDDIYYALYFADKFGHIIRIKKGRSYQLYLPGTIETANTIKATP
jgi:hypothetical protein